VSPWNGLIRPDDSLAPGRFERCLGQARRFTMLHTMTTADWLRRAADVWDEADAAQGPEARQAKVTLAQEYERLAKHAAYLAHHDFCLAGDDQIDH
jgi:hypothetical protein